MDISVFFNQFVESFYYMFEDFYNILDSIRFNGISLLSFIITIVILGAVLPIIINLGRSHAIGSKHDYKRSKRNKNKGD